MNAISMAGDYGATTGAVVFVVVTVAYLLWSEYGHWFGRDVMQVVENTNYAPPLRYSVRLLRVYTGDGNLLKALREAYPYMPITVARNMIAEHQVQLASGLPARAINNLVSCILQHAPDCNARVELDGTDVGFTLREWAEVHCVNT